MKRAAVVLCLLLSSACGGTNQVASQQPTAPVVTTPPRPTNTPVPPSSSPHFATPEAAMRYLASAWNRGDLVQLKHVTDPQARGLLLDMHREAADLKLDHCTFTKDRGDYECFFTHGFPKGYVSKGPMGTAEFTVGPARKPGWYMTYFIDCGG